MSQTIESRLVRLGRSGRWASLAAAVTGLGLVVTVALVMLEEHGTQQFYRSFLTSFMFVLSLALGGLFFVLVTHLTRAAWSVVLRRIAEILAWSILPLSIPALLIIVGMHDLYEWTHHEAVAHDALLQHKQPWLNSTFFIIRFAFYFIVWNLTAWYYLRTSVRQDQTRDPELTLQMERVAAPAMIFFAMTVTFAVFDWVMSLYPHWYSTIYGVYYFAGCVLGFFSLTSLLTILLQRAGKLEGLVTVEHYHDMGKMMFAFVVFWAYIAFSQYMLIWYANVPEETAWYAVRQSGPWLYMSLLLLFGHFVVPFLWLLSRYMKRRKTILATSAVWLLVMHWLDLNYLIAPNLRPDGPLVTPLDVACLVLMVGFVLATVLWRLGKVNLVPIGDPRLEESMRLENV